MALWTQGTPFVFMFNKKSCRQESGGNSVFLIKSYTNGNTDEHPLCSILRHILLAWDQNTFCVRIWPEHPFFIFYYENLPFDTSFFHPDTQNTRNTPEHPQIPLKRVPFVFWWHQNTLCVPFWNFTSRLRPEHPLCSILKLILLAWDQNTFCVRIWPEHPFLLKGIWGVRVCSGCSGCPGEKTKHQKARFHNRKLEKGVQVKSEHKGCSDLMLEV